MEVSIKYPKLKMHTVNQVHLWQHMLPLGPSPCMGQEEKLTPRSHNRHISLRIRSVQTSDGQYFTCIFGGRLWGATQVPL